MHKLLGCKKCLCVAKQRCQMTRCGCAFKLWIPICDGQKVWKSLHQKNKQKQTNKSNSFDDQMSKNIKNGMIPCVLMGYFVISIIVNVIFGDDVSRNDRLTSLISSLACCSLSGLLVNCSLASASRFFCSNIWLSCHFCHVFIRWSNTPWANTHTYCNFCT